MEDHIFIYNEIGSWGTTSQEIQQQVTDSKSKNLTVHISSPGGEVFEGWTIGNILKHSGKNVTVIIEGLCASIATYIALQATTIKMADTARFMIHNPLTGVEGEQKDLMAAAKQLESIKSDLIKTYSAKTGVSDVKISEMMDNETWLTADEAKSFGFIDEIIAPSKAVAYLKPNNVKKMSTETEKESEKKESRIEKAFDSFFAKMEAFVSPKNMEGEPTNVTLELDDDSMLFVDSEDGELEGKVAYVADAEGNQTEELAAEGTYTLKDGRSLTVIADGIVESVQEVEEDEATAALENEIADLKSQLENSTKENSELKNTVAENEKSVKEIKDEVLNLKKVVIGSDAPVNKAVVKPKGNEETQQESTGMSNFAAHLKLIRNEK